MTKIFVSEDHDRTRRWKQLEETNVARFLADPVRTGEVHLHNPNKPILEEVTDKTSSEQFWAFMPEVNIVTNYGLAIFFASGTTHILPPERGRKGYVIPQLTDMVVDYETFEGAGVNLTANRMKMSDAGRLFRIDGTFDEIMQELREHYRFVRPEDGQSEYAWRTAIKEEIKRQREEKIDDEFVERVNREYYSWFSPKYPATKESMLEHFNRVRL